MVIYSVKCGNEKLYETTSYSRALEYANEIDKQYGSNSASIWKLNTNEGHIITRMNTKINDNSIVKK